MLESTPATIPATNIYYFRWPIISALSGIIMLYRNFGENAATNVVEII